MSLRLFYGCLLLSLAVLGCGYRERGRFAAVAAGPLTATAVPRGPAVIGRACFGAGAEFGDDRVIDAAVRDALTQAPGTDALVNAEIVDEGACLRVQGRAIRLGAP